MSLRIFSSKIANITRKASALHPLFERSNYGDLVEQTQQINRNKRNIKKIFNVKVKDDSDVVYISLYHKKLNNIADKVKDIKDKKIKKHINEKLGEFFVKDDIGNFYYCESLADAYNVLNSRYSMLGEVDDYYKEFKKSIGEDDAKFLSHLVTQKPRTFNKFYKIIKDDPLLVKTIKEEINFKNDSRLEALKTYIADYSNQEPEMTNYMYEKYYLPRLDKNIKKSCKKIASDFGTKVFVFDEKEQEGLDYIYNELTDWKRVGKDQAKFPNILDLSRIKDFYIRKEKPSAGVYISDDNSISLRSLDSLRHEMIHANDKYLECTGVINGINSDEIIRNKIYKKEFLKVGVDPKKLDYVYKDKGEFVAYIAKTDYSKYTEGFKSVLTRLGLPEWFFELKPFEPYIKD